MDANHLLLSLGHIMGLSNLRFDDHGCARLVFDQTLAVDMEHDAANECIHVYSVLGRTPSAGSGEAIYRRLLEGNLHDAPAHGAMPAVDAQNDEIVLCRRLELAAASPDGFTALIEKFLTALEYWRDVFTADLSGATPTTAGPRSSRAGS
jgi:Tir chaperone protein (CesT) family